MTVLVVFGHGALAILLCPLAFVGNEARQRSARGVALIGVALATLGLAVADDLAPWRGVAPDRSTMAVAAVSAGAAWLLVAARELGDERWRTAVVVGAVSSGLMSFAGSTWVAPALLFWGVLAAGLMSGVASGSARAVLALCDAALVTALVADAVTRSSWRVATPGDWEHWVLVAVAIARCVSLPRFGVAGEVGGRGACVAPLVAGSGFVVALGAARGAHPWASAALVVVALAVALWAALRPSLDASIVIAWPGAVAMGLVLVAPAMGVSAAIAGLLSLTLVATWPDSVGRARLGRAGGLVVLPPAIGFVAMTVAAGTAFARATDAPSVAAGISWTLVAALLPAVLAAGVVLAAALSRQEVTDVYEVPAVVATWALFATGIAFGLGGIIADRALVPGQVTLYVVGLAAGVGASYLARAERPAPGGERTTFEIAPWRASERVDSALVMGSAAIAVAAAATIGWFTYRGLSVGFL